MKSLPYTNAYLTYFLLFGGIIENPAYKYVEYLISLTMSINFCIFAIGVYVGISFNALSLVEKAVMQQQLVNYAFSLVWHFTMKFNRNNLLKMKENFCNSDNIGDSNNANLERKIQSKTEKRLRKVAVFLTEIPAALYLLYMFPVYDIIMKLTNHESTYQLTYPKWYECSGNVESAGSVLKYLCWNVSNYKQFLIKLFVVSILEIGVIPSDHSSRVLLVLIWINMNVRLTAYKKQLEKSFEKIKNLYDLPSDDVDCNVKSSQKNLDRTSGPIRINVTKKSHLPERYDAERELKKFIRLYQYYCRIISPIVSAMDGITNCIMCALFPTLTLAVFCFVTTERAGLTYYDFMNLIAAIFILFDVATICYVSDRIKSFNDKVSFMLYDIPWYNFPVKTRKLLIITLTMLKRTTLVSCVSMYCMDIPRFDTIVKTLYNVVSLLRVTYKS